MGGIKNWILSLSVDDPVEHRLDTGEWGPAQPVYRLEGENHSSWFRNQDLDNGIHSDKHSTIVTNKDLGYLFDGKISCNVLSV